jgi:hypothetical protein
MSDVSAERLKVLEMVAESKITPEEGVRLLEALGESRSRPGFEIPPIRVPRIDLGHLGAVVLELKDAALEGARRAQGHFRRSRAGRFLDFKDFPISVDAPEGAKRCRLKLETRAGRLKVRGGESGGKLLLGKIKHAPEEPEVILEVREGVAELGIKHGMGRGSLRLHEDIAYAVALDSAAADTELDLEALLVDSLEIDNNAGQVSVRLGGRAERINVEVKNNAGNVQFKAPETHALKVQPSGNLSSHNLSKYGLEVVDGVAASSDWEQNANRVEIMLNQNVANFTLEWKRRDGVEVKSEPPACCAE